MTADKQKDGGPAFPRPPFALSENQLPLREHDNGDTGMSLRDWFAGQALVGMLSMQWISPIEGRRGELARDAYAVADAMLAERDAKP